MSPAIAPTAAPMPANAATSSGSEDVITSTIIIAEMAAMMAATSTITNGVINFASFADSSAKNRSGFVRTFVI